MQIEQIAESYDVSPRKTDNLEYGRLELYSLGALRFYTGLLGGNNSLFRSAPLGGGSLFGSRPLRGGLFGGESIFDRMERLVASRPLITFKPAEEFGLGIGIAKLDGAGLIERYRKPETDEANGFHMNLEYFVPKISKKKRPFINIHIPLNDDEK